MKLLVTGGTGVVGEAAVTELLGQAAEDARLAAALASIYARDAAGSTVPDAATAG